MKTIRQMILIASVLCSSVAFAGIHDPVVNRHQLHQQVRIEQGIRHGNLTVEEARHLRREQRDIRQQERHFKADGKLTGHERRALRRDLRSSSRHIYREKHDHERRFGHR